MSIYTPHRVRASFLIMAMLFWLSGCNSKTPEEHIHAAKQYLLKHDTKSAALELKTALDQQPDNADARLLLGKSHYMAGDYLAAEKELLKAREQGAAADTLIPLLGRLYTAMQQPNRVIEVVKAVPTLSPDALATVHAIRANAYLTMGNRDAAHNEIGQAELLDPKHPDILLTKARFAVLDDQLAMAMELINNALKADPLHLDALYLKAAIHSLQKQNNEAIHVYQRIISNYPLEFRAHIALAQYYIEARDFTKAAKALENAEKIAPRHNIIKFGRAMLSLQQGKLKEANDAILQTLSTSNHIPSLLVHTITNFGLRNYEQSVSSAQKVLQFSPNDPIATKYLAASLIELKQPQKALSVIEPLLKDHTEDAQLLALAGDAHYRLRDYDKAMPYLSRASALEPDNPVLLTKLGEVHLARGSVAQATQLFERAIQKSQRPGPAETTLILLYVQQGRFDDALRITSFLEQKAPNSPATHNFKGLVHLARKDFTVARKSFEQSIALKPDFFPAAANLARLDAQHNRLDLARKRFESVLAHDKKNIQAMLALAELAAAQNNHQEQLKWLDLAAKTNPNALLPVTQLIRFHMAHKQHNKALAMARDLVNAHPKTPEAFELLGAVQLATQDYPGAISSFSSLVKLSPDNPEAYYQLALALLADKQYEKGRHALHKSIELKPGHFKALDTLLGVEWSEGKIDEALRIARKMQAINPKSPLGYDREGDLLAARNDISHAIEAYELALSRGGGASSCIKLHRTLYTSGRRRQAEQRMLAYIQANPKDISIRAYAAQFYSRTGRYHEAIAQYESILAMRPDNAALLRDLALLYLEIKDPRALGTAENAHKLAPDNASVLDALGWILLQSGHAHRGYELLSKAIAKESANPRIRYHYAVALAGTGKNEQARNELSALLASKENFAEREEAKATLQGLLTPSSRR